MEPIKIKLTAQQVKAVFTVIEKVIAMVPDTRENALVNILFTRLYSRLRTRVENGRKNMILKPEEAYALDLFFEFQPGTTSYEGNIMNSILLELQTKLKP